MKKRLPIGIQTFRNIRDQKDNYAYIDKTGIAYTLITSCKYAFLSRPRRFGKSLFVDTLAEIFKGNKQYFEGLEIYDKWDWNETFPIINISFGSGSYTNEKLIYNEFERIFRENNEAHNLNIAFSDIEDSKKIFGLFINACYKKYNKKVVILIDEYDKLILDNIHFEDKTMTLKGRNILKNFYSALKDNEQYLHFVFLTGVSKFSKLNLFSGLNNIEDITIKEEYATITGYTHDDLIQTFPEYLEGVDLDEVKRWYNGYNYFGEPIYNPFDILLFLSNGCQFSNYWWETGNPSFLIELLKKGKYHIPDFENTDIDQSVLNSFDIEEINFIAILWQTGYLTFKSSDSTMGFTTYRMKVPNVEIQHSLNKLYLDYLTGLNYLKVQKIKQSLLAILNNKPDELKSNLIALFDSIPYNNYVNNTISSYEGYYSSVIYTFLSSLGFTVICEDSHNKGRIDLTLLTPSSIYIFEFKVDCSDETAIKQIEDRKYYQKYLADGKDIYLVGIHFDSVKRNITEFDWRKL
jgi:hypothetical protein